MGEEYVHPQKLVVATEGATNVRLSFGPGSRE